MTGWYFHQPSASPPKKGQTAVVNLGDRLVPLAESLLQPGETLLGCCIATQQSLLSGRPVAIVTTDRRLIVQGLTRRFEAHGEPSSLPPERIADVSIEGGGAGWATVGSMILDAVSALLKVRTTDGEKLTLTMMTGEGLFATLGGGDTQREGLRALGKWFADRA
jgi:hypothetical protein